MSRKALSVEEMRLKGLEMIRKAKEKERAEQQASRLKLGELLEQHIADGFRHFSIEELLPAIEKITGKPISFSPAQAKKETV